MKKYLILICLMTMSGLCFSQQDSTLLKFSYPVDKDLKIRDALLGIQQVNVECRDEAMRGKKFFLTVSEFQNGKITKNDTSNAICGEEIIPIKVGDKLYQMHVSICDKMSFGKKDSVFTLSTVGIFRDSVFKMRIIYPGMSRELSLKANADYLLRWTNACMGADEMRVPTGKKIPVLTYAPPVRAEKDGYASYCIQGEAEVESWFASFGMEHYYVFYLDVE